MCIEMFISLFVEKVCEFKLNCNMSDFLNILEKYKVHCDVPEIGVKVREANVF